MSIQAARVILGFVCAFGWAVTFFAIANLVWDWLNRGADMDFTHMLFDSLVAGFCFGWAVSNAIQVRRATEL